MSIMTNAPSAIAADVQVIESKGMAGETLVAAYCRVSTDHALQKSSLDTQIAAYSKVIQEHPGWKLAGIYTDEGLSGTTVKHRKQFKRMVEDAKAGKINYIIAKSISRFARNTVECLAYVRELKSYGVSVFFEKEKLDTGNAVSEFLLSIFAAAAQEEIISLSNNMKVGRRMRYAAGIAQWTRIYGLRCAEDGTWYVEEEEAKVIRRIFEEYTSGHSLPTICKGLMADGIPSTGGKTVWIPKSLADVLHNEKYMGDLRMQKSYISDPIQHTKVNNRDATLKQYYKENHHPAIVDREIFHMAQKIAAMKDMHRGTGQYPYYGFLKCPICGSNMVRFSCPRNNVTFGWTCGGKPSEKGNLRRQRTACPPYFIIEGYIDDAIRDGIRALDKKKLEEQLSDVDSGPLAEKMLSLKADFFYKSRQLEYRELWTLVNRISFPQWSVMRIEWKNGMTSMVDIKYRKMSDMPYPNIKIQEIEHTVKNKGTKTVKAIILNGEPQFERSPWQQYQGIKSTQETVLNLTIQEARNYEPDVPRVSSEKKFCTEDLEGHTEKKDQKKKSVTSDVEPMSEERRTNQQ